MATNGRKGLRPFRISSLLLILWVFGGCQSLSTPNPPIWWGDNARRHDDLGTRGGHLYFTAHARSRISLEAARQEAMRSIQRQVAEYILTDIDIRDDLIAQQAGTEGAVLLQAIEQFEFDSVLYQGSWWVWLMGRYPLTEYESIRRRQDIAQRLRINWAEAQSLVNRRQWIDAEPLLLIINADFDEALNPGFDVAEVKLSLASIYFQQHLVLQGRKWLEDVAEGSLDPKWRQIARERLVSAPAITIRDAFVSGPLMVVGFRQGGHGFVYDAELTSEMAQRARQRQVPNVVALDRAEAVGLMDLDSSALTRMGSAHPSGALLIAKLSVDGSKTGKSESLPDIMGGGTRRLHDAMLAYQLVRLRDGDVLLADNTIGFSENWQRLITVIMGNQRHLPGHAFRLAMELM
jgi:hypothetical protein